MERDQVIQVGRLRGIEKFEGEIENFILNTFINFKPVKRFENRSGVSEFRSFNTLIIHSDCDETYTYLLLAAVMMMIIINDSNGGNCYRSAS